MKYWQKSNKDCPITMLNPNSVIISRSQQTQKCVLNCNNSGRTAFRMSDKKFSLFLCSIKASLFLFIVNSVHWILTSAFFVVLIANLTDPDRKKNTHIAGFVAIARLHCVLYSFGIDIVGAIKYQPFNREQWNACIGYIKQVLWAYKEQKRPNTAITIDNNNGELPSSTFIK